MPYDRAEEDTTKVAQLLKYDDSDLLKRPLINVILEALDYSESDLQSNSVSTIASALDTLLSR